MKNKIYLSYLCASLTLFQLNAFGWGVKFAPMPIDIDQNCTATILKATETGGYAGIGFLAPKVLISTNKNGDHLFDIIPTGNGSYLLRVGVYLPIDSEAAASYRRTTPSSLYQNVPCDLETVRNLLKHQVQNPSDHTTPIHTITMLPIREIDVKITGLDSVFKIGDSQTGILNYANQDWIVEIPVPNEAKLQELLTKLKDRMGLQIEISMHFNAQETTGSAVGHLSFSDIQTALNLDGNLKSKYTATQVELATAIKNDIAKTNIQMDISGDNPDLTDLINRLILGFANVTPPDPSSPTIPMSQSRSTNSSVFPPPTAKGTTPPPITGPGGIVPPPIDSSKVQPPIPPGGITPIGGIPGLPSSAPAADGSSLSIPLDPNTRYSVKAFFSYIKQHKDIDLAYTITSGDKDSTYTTNVLIPAKEMLQDGANYVVADDDSQVLPYEVKAGETLKIAVTEYSWQAYTGLRETNSRLLTKKELLAQYRYFMDQQVTVKANHESVQPFPALHKIDFNQLRDVWNNNSSSNEADFVLKSKSKWNLFSLDSPLNPINWMSSPLFALALLNPSSAEDTARWGLVSTQPAYGPSHTIEYDQPSEPRPDYARLPLDFRFTALGTHHFTFSELMHANDNPVLKKYLSIKIGDFGGVTITAKQDLGTLKITNRYSIKTKQEFMKYYYEEQLHRNQVTHSFTLCDDAQAVPLFHTQYNLEITQPKNKGSQVHQLEVQKSQLRTSDERMRIIP